MIIKKWLELQQNGITMDMIYITDYVNRNPRFDLYSFVGNDAKIVGVIKTAIRKSLFSESFEILENGKSLLQYFYSNSEEDVINKPSSFIEFTNSLHVDIQGLLLKLTGKKQKTDKIKNKSYSFLCNPKDLHTKLLKVKKLYGMTDLEKAKKVILNYVTTCHRENSWFPILEYYIEKEGKSKFYTDYCNFDEAEIEQDNKPKEIKNLF